MKYILVSILFFSIASSATNAEYRPILKKKTKVFAQKKKSRSIASVDKAGINEQISSLESQSKKTKKDYIAISELYLKIKNYDKAISNLQMANKPQSTEVLDLLARAYNGKGDIQEETRALELIKVEGKASPGQLSRLGDALSKNNKISEAIPIYREAIAKAPKYEKSYEGLFKAYIEIKNFYDARLVIIEVLEKFGDKKFWLNELCRIEIEQSYHDSAKKICPKAISKDPKNPDNHVNLALAFKFTENEDQARKIIFKAAKQFKKSEVTQWNAGQMSCSIKNWEQATEQFKNCVKADANSGRCYLGLGKAQFELKKYDQALESMIKSCPYVKGADVEIRRLSYALDEMKDIKTAKKYVGSTDKCSDEWFTYAKKNKDAPVYKINQDQCFNPSN